MKKLIAMLSVMFFLILTSTSYAIQIYVDTHLSTQAGTNQWADDNFSKIADGTFVNMSGSYDVNNIGTTSHHTRDKTAYNVGNGWEGNQLTFVFWIPNVTSASVYHNILTRHVATYKGSFFETSGWIRTPALYDYAGGVIGWHAFGWNSTSKTQSGLIQDLNYWSLFKDSVRIDVNFNNNITSLTSYNYRTASIPSTPVDVPEPVTILLFGGGLSGLLLYRRKMNKV